LRSRFVWMVGNPSLIGKGRVALHLGGTAAKPLSEVKDVENVNLKWPTGCCLRASKVSLAPDTDRGEYGASHSKTVRPTNRALSSGTLLAPPEVAWWRAVSGLRNRMLSGLISSWLLLKITALACLSRACDGD
jgi:hypothetical protein